MKCKFQVPDTKNSTWNNKVTRDCMKDATKDGYCAYHHPDSIADRLEKEALKDIIEDLSIIKTKEAAIVGQYLQKMRPDEFEKILLEVKLKEEILKKFKHDYEWLP